MCARAPVQVTTMPGFGAPLSNTYSGYVAAGAGKHHHVSLWICAAACHLVENPRAFPFHALARLCSQYVYMESLNNPATDDLVIWFNGGKWRALWRGGDVPRACADRFFFFPIPRRPRLLVHGGRLLRVGPVPHPGVHVAADAGH
jgi:hypothetical protein